VSEEADPCYTPTLKLIELHYELQGDLLNWTPNRYRKLAGWMKLTVYELGAMIRLTPKQVDACLKKRKFTAPVELHLLMIENAVFPNQNPLPLPIHLTSQTDGTR